MNGLHIKILGAVDDAYVRVGGFVGVRKFGEHLDIASFFPSARQDERILVARDDIRKLGEVLIEIGRLKESGEPFMPERRHV